jgi:hypothetical protein|tara:strand:- start:101 stop:304 length:204 start_codon:yes stop_codon:yes gene_type:complete
MRTIKVKEGKSKYKLKADDGTYIGEIMILYDPETRKGTGNGRCGINMGTSGATIDVFEISVRGYGKK